MQGGRQGGQNRPDNNATIRLPQGNRPDFGSNNRPGNNNAMGPPHGNRPGFSNRPGFGNTRPGFGNNRPARPDFNNFRFRNQNFRARRRFRAPAYRPPPGFFARRWSWGMMLPSLFWARQFWLTDFALFDLPPPPFGTVWVRVGEDALLIDQSSGMIITVAYGVFY